MTEDKITRPTGEALSKICEELFEQPKQEDEFSIKDVCDRLGSEYKTIAGRLKKMEEQGILSSRIGRNGQNRPTRLYKYVEQD